MKSFSKREFIVVVACLIMFVGVGLYYYFYRQGIGIYVWLGVDSHFTNPLVSNLLASLPSFTHVFMFSLWTWWAIGKQYTPICIGLWFFINLFFELLQGYRGDLINSLPTSIYDYIYYGTLSCYDVFALFFGALASFVVIRWIQGEKQYPS